MYSPFGLFTMFAMFDRPSNVENPIVSVFLFIAHDWSWLFLPKSCESKIVLLLALFISMIPIFSFPRPVNRIGYAKSLEKTLFPMSMVKTGWLFPGCQKWMLFSKAAEIITFWFGIMCKAEIAAPCFPTSLNCWVWTLNAWINPVMSPT